MTAISLETIEVLNALIEINNDRVETYRLAIRDLADDDIDAARFFRNMIEESRRNNIVLSREVDILGGEVEQGTSLEGKIYRAWMNVKNVFTGKSKLHVLQNCELTEDATLDAYRAAVQCEDMPGFLKETISDQLDRLLHAHDLIGRMKQRSRDNVSGKESENIAQQKL